jgi:hypothetical protein
MAEPARTSRRPATGIAVHNANVVPMQRPIDAAIPGTAAEFKGANLEKSATRGARIAEEPQIYRGASY